MRVRVGVEWVNHFPLTVSQNPDEDVSECQQPDLRFEDQLAWGFYNIMGYYGHESVFAVWDKDAWADHFRHNIYGGDALHWSDNVHFCYYASHAGQFPSDPHSINKVFIAFATQHQYCLSSSERWLLGSGLLKWFVLDGCEGVLNTTAEHVVAVWSGPMRGVHMVFTFIGLSSVSQANWGRGGDFAREAAFGHPLGNAWLDVAYWRSQDNAALPIVIAAGVSRDDAVNRRENETIEFRDIPVTSTNWLAWKWRE